MCEVAAQVQVHLLPVLPHAVRSTQQPYHPCGGGGLLTACKGCFLHRSVEELCKRACPCREGHAPAGHNRGFAETQGTQVAPSTTFDTCGMLHCPSLPMCAVSEAGKDTTRGQPQLPQHLTLQGPGKKQHSTQPEDTGGG